MVSLYPTVRGRLGFRASTANDLNTPLRLHFFWLVAYVTGCVSVAGRQFKLAGPNATAGHLGAFLGRGIIERVLAIGERITSRHHVAVDLGAPNVAAR